MRVSVVLARGIHADVKWLGLSGFRGLTGRGRKKRCDNNKPFKGFQFSST
jgi:hypothetical protein